MAQQLTVTLPDDLADAVRARVASGEYASESEVIEDGLRALEEDFPDLDRWLREEVVPVMEEMDRDPSARLSIDDVRRTIEADRAARARDGT